MNNKLKQMGLIPLFLLMVFVLPTSAVYKFTDRKIFLPIRVHVFCFDQNFDLLPVGDGTGFEVFVQDPEAAANSLVPLLDEAESVVPEDLCHSGWFSGRFLYGVCNGGGSVQMAYAICKENAAKAPMVPDGQDPYAGKFFLRGAEYYVYVHSYLNYIWVIGSSSRNFEGF
ncbi:unnamed protein product [Dovyalis caffra]|uniref:Uncharacterized protein n=1 Tax=Dovyalis caffra TaxID=77055 RepID=A0AAV1RZ57_9ROSI|nr:unnamed protein product [Dovyalis caffra]